MSGRRFAIIDPSCGIAGDMLLGALVELTGTTRWLAELPRRLGLDGVSVDVATVMRSNIKATKVTVRLGRATEGPGDVSDRDFAGFREHRHDDAGHHHHPGHDEAGHHHHGGTHHHEGGDHPHRHVAELLALIANADLSPWVKGKATEAFSLLAQAEGRIHGVPPGEVMLHEVGAFDAVVDVVGAAVGFETLGITEVHARPAALGHGWVKTAHGVLPVPTPATSLLMEGLAIAPDGPVVGEATTPTGAALLRALSAGSAPARWRPLASGWGAGGRDPAHYPNVLRVTVGEPVAVSADDDLVMIATDIDDLSPEYASALRDELVSAGALDVVSWTTVMKKGRLGFRIEALTPLPRVPAVTEAFFRHSTTAGVRTTAVTRHALPREQWTVPGPGGVPIRVKTIHGPDGPRVKPEFDDVIAAARATGQPAHELSRRLTHEALGAARQPTSASRSPDTVPPKE